MEDFCETGDTYSEGVKIVGSTKELVTFLKEQSKNQIDLNSYFDCPNMSGLVSKNIPIDLKKIEELKEIKESYGRYSLVGDEYLCRISADKLFELFILGDKKEFHLTNRRDYPTLISCSSYFKEKDIYIFINLVQSKAKMSVVYDDVHLSYITVGGDTHGAILGKELEEVTDKIENFFDSYYKEYCDNGGNTELINVYKILNGQKNDSFFSKIFKKFLSYFNEIEYDEKRDFGILDNGYLENYLLNKNTFKIIKIYG